MWITTIYKHSNESYFSVTLFLKMLFFASLYETVIYLTEEIFRKAAVKLELVILNFQALDLTT